MKNKAEIKTKRKRKGKTGWIITLIIVAVLGIGGVIGWSYISKEHEEARNLPLDAVDFSKLNDGTYVGEYDGGMYKWRANKVQVTVSSGKVADIELIDSKEKNLKEYTDKLYDKVIKEQTLQVDVISGATLTSKSVLKPIEDALLKAENK